MAASEELGLPHNGVGSVCGHPFRALSALEEAALAAEQRAAGDMGGKGAPAPAGPRDPAHIWARGDPSAGSADDRQRLVNLNRVPARSGDPGVNSFTPQVAAAPWTGKSTKAGELPTSS